MRVLRRKEIGTNIILLICVVVAFLPIVWAFMCSFKDSVEMFSRPLKFFPESFRFENYVKAWTSSNLLRVSEIL